MKKTLIVFIILTVITTIYCLNCENKETWKIGCISPFTGNGAVYGQALKRGFNVYLDELEVEEPHVYKKIEIIYEDDKLDAREGVNALNKLINVNNVQVIIGAFTSNVTLAIAPIAEKSRVVLLTPTATNYKIKDAGAFIFRITPSDALQGKIMADFALNALRRKSAAILFMNTDYGVGLQEVFQEHFVKNGGTIVSVESFELGATDMRTQLQKLKSARPDVIFLPSNYVEASNVIIQAKELGIGIPFLGTDGIFDQKFLEITKEAAEGMYISTMAWGTAKYQEQADQFRAKFREKYNEEPGVYSALCYDALAVIVQALKNCSYDGTSIKSQLYKIQLVGATGLNKFDELGEVEKEFDVYQVKNYQFVKWGSLKSRDM